MVQQQQRRSALVVLDVLAILILGACAVAAAGLLGWGIFAFATYAPEATIIIVVSIVVISALVWVLARHASDHGSPVVGKGWLQ